MSRNFEFNTSLKQEAMLKALREMTGFALGLSLRQSDHSPGCSVQEQDAGLRRTLTRRRAGLVERPNSRYHAASIDEEHIG